MKNLADSFTNVIANGADISAIAACLQCSPSLAGVFLAAGSIGLSVAQCLYARKAGQSEKQRDEQILTIIAQIAEQTDRSDKTTLHLLRSVHRNLLETRAQFQGIDIDGFAARIDQTITPKLEAIHTAVMVSELTTLQVGDKLLTAIDDSHKDLSGKIEAINSAKTNPLSWEQQVAEYGDYFAHRFDKIRISALGGGEERDSVFTLSGLYVEPAIDRFVYRINEYPFESDERGAKHLSTRIGRSIQRYEKSLDMLVNPEVRRHVLLGGAGTGKSSVLRHLVLDWNRRRKSGEDPGPVPILIEVREFLGARDHARKNAIGDKLSDPLSFITSPCDRGWCFDHDTLLAKLHSGDAMLILDGLDEAFDPDIRDNLSYWLRSFARQYPRARIIASSRDNVFSESDWPREGINIGLVVWAIHTLVPFDQPRIATFLRRWYDAQSLGAYNTKVLHDDLARAIRDLPFLQPLAEVPLTLTMLCILGQNNISPESRTDVFNKATSLFIRQWDDARGLPKGDAHIVEKFRNYGEKPRHLFFRNVALKMVEAGKLANSNRISRADLRAILVGYFKDENSDDSNLLADGILRLLCERNFLLTQLASGEYAFFHRSFLEYYTALAWADQFANNRFRDPDRRKFPEEVFFEQIILPRLHDQTWSDTFHFLIGMMSPTPARAIIETIANLSNDDLARFGKNPDIEDDERAFAAKVFATELARDLQPDSDQDGRAIGGREVAASWKSALLQFAWSGWDYKVSNADNNNRRRDLRSSALVAIAALWRGDGATIDAFAEHLLVHQEWSQPGRLGKAMAIASPGHSEIFHLLLDIVNDPRRDAKSPPPTPADRLGRFTRDPNAAEVRDRAISALAGGWSGDSEAKAVLLRAAIGVPERQVPADENRGVRRSAVAALGEGWRGDNEAKAAVLRVLIGVPQQQIPPDKESYVRSRATYTLRAGWSGDSEAKAALLRVLIGLPDAGIPPDKDWELRRSAVDVLAKCWSGDSEAKAAILRVLIGVPDAGIPPDKIWEVRHHAVEVLSHGWTGDSEAKAAFLRVLIGVPDAGIPPDEFKEVRYYAATVLSYGWRGDSEVKAALLRAVVGVPAAGIPPDQNGDVREGAGYKLRECWRGDAEVRAALRGAVEVSTQKLGPQHEQTEYFKKVLAAFT